MPAPIADFSLHQDMPTQRQRDKEPQLDFKRGILQIGGTNARKEQKPAQNYDAEGNPVPDEKSFRKLGRSLPLTAQAQDPQIDKHVRTEPQAEAGKMDQLNIGIYARGTDYRSPTRLSNPFCNSHQQVVHRGTPSGLRYLEMLFGRFRRPRRESIPIRKVPRYPRPPGW